MTPRDTAFKVVLVVAVYLTQLVRRQVNSLMW